METVAAVLLGLFVLFFLWLFLIRRPPNTTSAPRCPSCNSTLTTVGFLSWNGGRDGRLNMLTNGCACASESFVAGLRQASSLAPPETEDGSDVRMVGSLTLLKCPACGGRFVDENSSGTLGSCSDAEWSTLTCTPAEGSKEAS